MTITDIRVMLAPGEGRLLAYARIVLDNQFAIHDFKIIQGETKIFIAMPSRKVMGRCAKCETKNVLSARFCNRCGKEFEHSPKPEKTHMDVAHPIHPDCRSHFEEAMISEYQAELERAKQPGYESRYYSDGDT